MNKEEILAKSRKENKDGDEREMHVRKLSLLPAFIAMGVVSILLMLAEFFWLETEIIRSTVYLLLMVTCCAQNWYLVATVRKKYLIFIAVCFTFSMTVAAIMFISAFKGLM